MPIDFREREREGEREKHPSVVSHTHRNQGLNLQPDVPQESNPLTFWLGQHSNQLSHTGQGILESRDGLKSCEAVHV